MLKYRVIYIHTGSERGAFSGGFPLSEELTLTPNAARRDGEEGDADRNDARRRQGGEPVREAVPPPAPLLLALAPRLASHGRIVRPSLPRSPSTNSSSLFFKADDDDVCFVGR